MATPLLEERIDPTDDVAVFLDAKSVCIQTDGGDGEVTLEPKTRHEANLLSMALRRAQRRIEAIGHTLPDEDRGGR